MGSVGPDTRSFLDDIWRFALTLDNVIKFFLSVASVQFAVEVHEVAFVPIL